MHKRIVPLAGFHDYIATLAAISARRASSRNELLPPKSKAAVPAVSGFHANCGLINEHVWVTAGVHARRNAGKLSGSTAISVYRGSEKSKPEGQPCHYAPSIVPVLDQVPEQNLAGLASLKACATVSYSVGNCRPLVSNPTLSTPETRAIEIASATYWKSTSSSPLINATRSMR